MLKMMMVVRIATLLTPEIRILSLAPQLLSIFPDTIIDKIIVRQAVSCLALKRPLEYTSRPAIIRTLIMAKLKLVRLNFLSFNRYE